MLKIATSSWLYFGSSCKLWSLIPSDTLTSGWISSPSSRASSWWKAKCEPWEGKPVNTRFKSAETFLAAGLKCRKPPTRFRTYPYTKAAPIFATCFWIFGPPPYQSGRFDWAMALGQVVLAPMQAPVQAAGKGQSLRFRAAVDRDGFQDADASTTMFPTIFSNIRSDGHFFKHLSKSGNFWFWFSHLAGGANSKSRRPLAANSTAAVASVPASDTSRAARRAALKRSLPSPTPLRETSRAAKRAAPRMSESLATPDCENSWGQFQSKTFQN